MALKTLHVIKQRLLERPIELAQARQAGFTVLGWSGDHIPEEIIYALGFIPLRIGLGGDERLAEIGTRCTSYKQCVRETVGQSLDNQDIFMRQSDVLAFDATCLQTFRTAELIRAHYKCKVLVLGLPRNFYWKEARQYYIREVEYFTQLLEEYVGVRIEEKKLIAAVELYNKIRKAIRQIYEYKALTKAVIAWEDLYDIIQAGYYLDRVEYLSLLERVLHEIREQVALTMIDEVEDEIEDEVRIFISGSVIPRGERKIS